MKYNFFKKVANAVKESVSPTNTLQVIEAIHNEFDTAADRALEEANFIISKEGVNSLRKEKAKLMSKFGFTGTRQVEEVQKREAEEYTAKKKAEVVQKYKQKYPQYKFIFKEQIQEICHKYGLICGVVGMYKGDIPLKNLKEIGSFKVDSGDVYRLRYWGTSWRRDPSDVLIGNPDVISELEHNMDNSVYLKKIGLNENDSMVHYELERHHRNRDYHSDSIPFFICAPKSDMNIEGCKMKGVFAFKETPDPIVLHYVKDGFLIVTKWGIEGDDPIVNG